MSIMNRKLHKDCPGFEELSAYFDGELDSSSLEYKHIESCDHCRDELESLRKVSDSIKQEFLLEVPDDFAAEMIVAIKERKKKEKGVRPFQFRTIIRVAALFVITSLIIFHLIPQQEKIAKVQLPQKKVEPLIFLGRPILTDNLTALQAPPSRSYAAGTHNSIDLRKMMNVSTGNMARELITLPPDKNNQTAFIHPKVHQVWSVDNLGSAKKQMLQLAPSAKFTTDDTNIIMRVELTKKNLAELVRNCKLKGFRLLSPSQPQPEQRVFSGNQGDRVFYTATLVEPK